VTDDAELRARIEAQVAARRAGGVPSKPDPGEAEAEPADPSPGTVHAPASLTPTRPWARRSAPAPAAPSDEVPDLPPARPGEPVRPWLRRDRTGSPGPVAARSSGADGDEPAPTSTGLAPVRPWQARRPHNGSRPAVEPGPAPSNPEIVLRGLAEEPEPAVLQPAAVAGPAEATAPPVDGAYPWQRRAARWIFARRREDGDDEPGEAFALPEPDESFARPWHQPDKPLDGAPVGAPTDEVAGPPADAPADAPAGEVAADPVEDRAPGPPPTDDGPRRPSPGARPRPAPAARPAPGPARGSRPRPSPTPSRSVADRISADISRFLRNAEAEQGRGTSAGTKAKRGPVVSDRSRRWLVRTVIVVVIAAVAAVLLRAFVVQPYYIPSASMEPTLHGCTGCNDDHVLVDKISYRAHDVRQGDIVVFHRPADAAYIPEKVLIKRVIALPGDVVELKQGRVFVNGLVLDEPYVNKACGSRPTSPLTTTTRWKIPGNDVFVMGDNRCHSDDSRQFGPIAESSVIGRAFAIIWPVHRMRLL
jgi:signal peptidase I